MIEFKQDKLWNRAYLFLEYVEGETLDTFITNNPDLEPDVIADLIYQLSLMVKYLHNRRI